MNFETWHTTLLERDSLQRELLRFLRTHDDAGWRLTEWMRSVPEDHTEEQHEHDWRARTLQGVRYFLTHR